MGSRRTRCRKCNKRKSLDSLPIMILLRPETSHEDIVAFSTHIRGIYITRTDPQFLVFPGRDNFHTAIAVSKDNVIRHMTKGDSDTASSMGFSLYDWTGKCRSACEQCIAKITFHKDISYITGYSVDHGMGNTSTEDANIIYIPIDGSQYSDSSVEPMDRPLDYMRKF